MSPIEFAANFDMNNIGIYFGAKAFLGPLTAGLSFSGRFQPSTSAVAGVSIAFDGGFFGAGVKAKFTLPSPVAITISPNFWINAIPSHPWFGVDASFTFSSGSVGWEMSPKVAWNFLGTGATDGPDTGMIIKYFVNSASVNEATIAFKWSI
jgi:hypothetical protein